MSINNHMLSRLQILMEFLKIWVEIGLAQKRVRCVTLNLLRNELLLTYVNADFLVLLLSFPALFWCTSRVTNQSLILCERKREREGFFDVEAIYNT